RRSTSKQTSSTESGQNRKQPISNIELLRSAESGPLLGSVQRPRMTPKPSFRRPASHAHHLLTYYGSGSRPLLFSLRDQLARLSSDRKPADLPVSRDGRNGLLSQLWHRSDHAPVLLVDLTEKDRATASF